MKARKGAREQVNDGKTGNLGLQEGELPKFSLYCLLSRRRASQGQGSLQMSMAVKQQSNTKENLFMITGKEADHLHWQLGCVVTCILVLKCM